MSTSAIINQLTSCITDTVSCKTPPVIIAICGAADLGKSYLAEKLKLSLTSQHIITAVLSMDSFLMPKAQRYAMGLSGYQPEAYNIPHAQDCLQKFTNKRSFDYYPYDHKTGTVTESAREIAPCDVLLFEGLHVLHGNIARCIDQAVFIYTDDDTLVKIRSAADLSKRGLSKTQSSAISSSELALYTEYVAPYKIQSDLLLHLHYPWHFTMVKQAI